MRHYLRFVAVVAVLTALVVCVPVQAQTPEIDALRARAEQGDAEAQFNLGVIYDDGRGVLEDDVEAVRWYRLAAEQGLAEAQWGLGFKYDSGWGVPEDPAEAVQWYRLAAEQGYDLALPRLGLSYQLGQGVPQDYVQAHMWFNLEAARAPRWRRGGAAERRDTVADLMTPEQLAEAQRLAREWDAAHPQ